MTSRRINWWLAPLASLALMTAAGEAAAQSYDEGSSGGSAPVELSVLGGVQMLDQNDTAIPDHFFNVPLVAALDYRLSPVWAIEGDFGWMIPVKQSVDLGSGVSQDRKSPDVLSYQASLKASLPTAAWTPYVAAGAGAVTFLSSTDADRVPRLDQSKTVFAINFGAGASYPLASHWAVRADLRELAAFPSKSDDALSSGGKADAIWMGRAVVGLGYRF